MKKNIFISFLTMGLILGLALPQDAQNRHAVETGATFCQQTLCFIIKGFSREAVWAAANKAFQLNHLEILIANKDVLWGNEIVGGTLLIRVPERDQSVALIMIGDGYYIQSETPFVSISISITGMKNGAFYADNWWTSARKIIVEKQYYEHILDQIYSPPTEAVGR